MRKLLPVLFSALFLLACSEQQETEIIGNQSEVMKLTPQEAQKDFAKLLSKAIYNNADLRCFIKDEALAQFDNDYDVFYPFVKHKVVSNGQTFREILLSYCDSEETLTQIEESSLLLNILVPDLTLFGTFNAETWDVSSNDVAVISRDDQDNTLFEDGEKSGLLPLNEIPAFPCLVVKNNERLKVSNNATRAGSAAYEFIADVYNKDLNPETRHSSYDEYIEATDNTEFYVPTSDLHPSIISAWEEFRNTPQAFARDYVYYGINKTNEPGTLNRNMRESLYKFRVFPDVLFKISDQAGRDPQLVTEFTQSSRYLTHDEIIKKMWTDGKFEINIDMYIGADKTNDAMRQRIPLTLAATQLWSIEKVHIDHVNSTMFRSSKNTYKIDAKNLKPRWIYPGKLGSNNAVFVQPWDLYSYSTLINMFVTEYDDGQSIEEVRSIVNQYVNKFDASVEGSFEKNGVKGGMKMGYGYTDTTTTTSSIKITTTVGTDDLGNLIFNYSDPIIVDDSQKYTKGYKVFAIKSGNAVEAILLPKYVYY